MNSIKLNHNTNNFKFKSFKNICIQLNMSDYTYWTLKNHNLFITVW